MKAVIRSQSSTSTCSCQSISAYSRRRGYSRSMKA